MGHIYGDYAVFEHKIGFSVDKCCGIIVCGDRMDTRLFTINPEKPDKAALEEAGKIIKKGGLVAFPTETVYGLGGDALNKESSKKIYAAKGRPSDNPLIVHIGCMEDLYSIVKHIPEEAEALAEAFWPGPLTMIFEKSDKVPFETTGGLSTVAVRMPKDPIALEFIRQSGGYVAAPSANISGKPSPTLAKYVMEDMDGRIDAVIDGGEAVIGLESTIVDLTGEAPMILRPGYITREMLLEVLERVDEDKTMMNVAEDAKPKAPGMKYRHYAPKGMLTIIAGDGDKVVREINERTEEAMAQGKKTGVIATSDNFSFYRADVIKNAGDRNDETAIAKELYRILREFDDEDVEVIYSESFDEGGIGQAIMNRLLKAAGHHIEYI